MLYRLLWGASALLLLGLIALNTDANATTQVRSQTDLTGWWWYHGQTPAQVTDLINDNGARLVDIEVEDEAPLTLSVTMVKNEGAYASGWWWYLGQTAQQIGELLNTNNARLIDLEPYRTTEGLRFAAVMVPNEGGQAKAWWWYVGQTSQQVANLLHTNNARLVDLDTYLDIPPPAGLQVAGGEQHFYTAVMVSNTGADAKAWWWYVGQTPQQVADLIDANDARLVDIDVQDPEAGTLNVVMEACPCPLWWWYVGTSADDVGKYAAQNGARIIDIEAYEIGGQPRFAAVMVNNSNEITTRVGQMLRSGTDGAVGLYLKEVGGPVLAALQERRVFEPASTIKALWHVQAMRQVQAGLAQLTDQVDVYPSTQPPNDSCPDGAPTGATESLMSALAGMMQFSNNSQTRGVGEFVGFNTIAAGAQAIGMVDTKVNQTLEGCGAPPFNNLTLVDIGLLYESVADGTLLNETNRDTFFSLMAGKKMFLSQGFDFVGIWEDIIQIVSEEAPAVLNSAQQQAFLDQMEENAKAGSYTTCARTGPCSVISDLVDYRSVGGYALIPFCEAGAVVPREYVFGFFIDQATSQANANNTFAAVRAELLREQIRDALADWASCSSALTQPPTSTPMPTDTPSSPTDTPSAPTSTPLPAAVPGDVDCRGSVNAIDAAVLLQYIAGLLPSVPCPENADVNGDGLTNSVDVALILQYTAGLLTSLPP